MRRIVTIGLIAAGMSVVGVLMSLLVFTWFTRPDPGPFDRLAAERIEKLCGQSADCQVRLKDLAAGNWDTLYEWSGGNFSDRDISAKTGRPFHREHELARVIVLMHDGQIVSETEGDEGIESGIAGEVYLSCGTSTGTLTVCPAAALMTVIRSEAPGDPARGYAWPGTAYSLTQIQR